ncbi:MAG: hypothetical protein Q4D82_04650 [Neisseria sp.]|nr:hypothetical protein [Neisseria sp.]
MSNPYQACLDHFRAEIAGRLNTLFAEKGFEAAADAADNWEDAHQFFDAPEPMKATVLARWLNGNAVPEFPKVLRLAQWLDCEPEDIASEAELAEYRRNKRALANFNQKQKERLARLSYHP